MSEVTTRTMRIAAGELAVLDGGSAAAAFVARAAAAAAHHIQVVDRAESRRGVWVAPAAVGDLLLQRALQEIGDAGVADIENWLEARWLDIAERAGALLVGEDIVRATEVTR